MHDGREMDATSESTHPPSFTDATAESPSVTRSPAMDNARTQAQTQAPSEPATDTPVAAKVQQLADRALQFLSSASNEALGACVVGLGATTYFVLGRVGLVLIGVIGGVVLHATWDHAAQDPKDGEARAVEIKRRKQTGLEVVSHVLEWRRMASERNEEVDEDVASNFKGNNAVGLGFADFQPSTAAAMTGLIDAVVRDYVKWWYGPLIPTDQSFPSSCRQSLTQFLLAFSSHLSRKRPADSFVNFLTNTSSIVIVFLNELSSALMRSESSNLDCSTALTQYIEEHPDSHLATITDLEQQKQKLKAIAEDILYNFLDRKTYQCEPARVFFREVLSELILGMTIESCSKPEFINGWIVYLLEEVDTELMDAIDAGVGGATANGAAVRSPAKALDGSALSKSGNSNDAQVPEAGTTPSHKRSVSRAEDAMEEAMQEAKRLTELIAAEEAKKSKELSDTTSSGTTTANGPTPTSSESDLEASTRSFDENLPPYSSPTTQTAPTPTFTTFDQILPQQQPTALQANRQNIDPVVAPLTLYNASVSIFDDEQPGEKTTMRSKPTIDYLLQIEPATSQHPGWMIARKYADFETLHEVLRRISVVSGIAEFAERHASVPTWKNRTKAALRKDLEHYLRVALSFNRLAESEAMKRFLEKDQGLGRSSPNTSKGGFGFPSPAAFETMGKGMLDVLSSAPKGAASGGKAVVGGFTGVLGIGQKKSANGTPTTGGDRSVSKPRSSISPSENHEPIMRASQARESTDSLRNTDGSRSETNSLSPLPERPFYIPQKTEYGDLVPSIPPKDTSRGTSPNPSFEDVSKPDIHLPPPPSEISDDYNTFRDISKPPTEPLARTLSPKSQQNADFSPTQSRLSHNVPRPASTPLTEPETCVAVELFFALITELYTLSSAWTIRLTLLSAAKTYLLRPGNPSLSSIRSLIQDIIIDANTSDEGLAAHITKLRENALPTEEEMKKWPKPMTVDEKEKLRIKARKLLTEKGVPTAVRGVVGQAATAEAMGRVFDSLQVERVARGFVFAIVLQAVKAVAQ
ncbi:MAG: hypothetical protein Q9191_005977 [Dirinaria sp. TL-2023a]